MFQFGCAHSDADFASRQKEKHQTEASEAAKVGDKKSEIEELHKASRYEDEENKARVKAQRNWGPFYYAGSALSKFVEFALDKAMFNRAEANVKIKQ